MMFGMYSVYDDKAKAFITPFFLPTDAMAVREFSNAANDRGHKFHQNPEDFVLYRIGGWDSDTGELSGPIGSTVLCRAIQVRKSYDVSGQDARSVQ